MNIFVDYTLARQHIGGMGVYVRNIVKYLKIVDRKNKYFLWEGKASFQKKGLFPKLSSFVREHLIIQTTLTKIINRDFDLAFFPNPPVPFFTGKPVILTIADMAFYFEKEIPLVLRFYLFILYFLSAKRAKIITTFSQNSKKDIANILKVDPQKVVITPLAASDKFKPLKRKKYLFENIKKYGVTKPFILCSPGTFLRRKNIEDLLIAFSDLKKSLKNSLQVVLVGDDAGQPAMKLKQLAKDLNIKDSVIFTGYIKPESRQLVEIYNCASIFVYPSLYEGFGLPPIEAMKCGIPTIVYNKSSLPEVVGKASIVINNSKELTAAIEKTMVNKVLRNSLIDKGFLQAKKYSWSNSARILFDTLTRISQF